MEHLVYCDKQSKVLDKLLDGSKTKIIRGAAGRKLPHSRVFAGETLYFVENDGTGIIKAKAKVKSVFNSEKMTPEESIAIVDAEAATLNLSPKQYERWAGKKVLCIIEVENVEPIEPMEYDRQKNMDDWITVEDIHSILVGGKGGYESIRIK